MSASTCPNTGNSASDAGTGRPDCAINVSNPTVFNVTVFPPVLGPLMSSVRIVWSSSRLIGSTFPLPAQHVFEQRMARLAQAEFGASSG